AGRLPTGSAAPDAERSNAHRLRQRDAREKRQGGDASQSGDAHLFTEYRQPGQGEYLAVPRTSSELRRYLPIGFLPHTTVAANDLQIIPGATRYEFGVLSSAMHIAWARATAGRLKSDLRYSARYTYNTFAWPQSSPTQRAAIESAAQAALDARV
ncbi:MAG: type IIL restriction-modification enzyme MmeI, partial [Burkholderiaceae bacterium]